MGRKVKKAKHQEPAKAVQTNSNALLVVIEEQQNDLKDWLSEKEKTGPIEFAVLSDIPATQNLSSEPEQAILQIKNDHEQTNHVLLVAKNTTKEELDNFFNWYKKANTSEHQKGYIFSTGVQKGFLQRLVLFFINLLYGLGLKGKPTSFALFPKSMLDGSMLYGQNLSGFAFTAYLSDKSPYMEEVVLPNVGASLSFKDFVLQKLAYFKFFFYKRISQPIKEINNDKALLTSLKHGNHGAYNLLYHGLLLFAFILFPLLSFDYGITWDEPVLSEYAEDILKFYASDGENREVFDMTKHARNATVHYSASFDVIAALLHKYISPFGIYETRHLLNALMGVLAILFSARIGRELGSWRMGALVAIFMLLSPRYFGHSMNNPKDIPFLLGYAAGLYYMIRFFKQLPNPTPTTLLWLTFSMAFMISVKIGGLIIVGLFGLFCGVYWLGEGITHSWKKATSHLPKYLAYLVGIIIVSYLLGIWFWPWGYEKPFENPLLSLTEFTNFRFLITYELFEGERINMDSPPWYYTFKWIGITAPLFVLIGFVFSLLVFAKKSLGKRAFQLMLIFAFLFPIVYTIVQNSTLYSGWRHLMFVYVPLVVLAASGWEWLINLEKKWIPTLATVLILLLATKPLYWIVKNHPNQYVYFNELTGGINGAYKEYETEYWCNSMKQAVEWLIENEEFGEEKIRIAANFEITTAQYFANKYPEKIQMLWTRENEKYKEKWDYAFFGTRGMPKQLIEASFPPKGTIHMIKADTVPLLAIVKSENDYIAQAFKLRGENKRNEALELAEKAVAFEPNNVEAQRIKGMLLIDLNKNDEAIRTLSKVIALNPDDFVAYTLAGIAYNRKKQYEDAIRLFNKSIELKVNNTSGYLNRGRAYMALKNLNLALENFQEAAKYDNGRNPRIYVEASIALLQQGLANPNIKRNRFELAIRNMKLALQMNPNQKDVIQNLVYAYRELGDESNAQKYQQMLQGT